jgi:HAD superfamily hydrolase (TIGR01509 family)
VLVDSEAISARVFQLMISELGVEIDFETIHVQITGTSMQENLKYISKYTGIELPGGFEKEFRKRSYEAFKTDLKPIEGVHDLLKKIKVPVGVASSGPAEKIRLNLTTTNLIGFFGENIFSCYDIGSWKPEPDIYLHAASSMGFKPNECVVIEDSTPGIQAAKAGGFDVFGFAPYRNKDLFEITGATIFYKMMELNQLLGIE